MSKILIKNGRVIDPASQRDEVTDILIVDQDISAIGALEADAETKVIDASGKLVMPGVIDLHVHLRDMEQAEKETIVTGTKAARQGGVTTVLAMPNTKPPLDDVETIRRYQELIKDARITVLIAGAITRGQKGKELAEIERYPELGIRFITDDGFDVDDETVLRQAYKKAGELDLILMTHPEIHGIAPEGVINEGQISEELEVPGQPNEKEWKAVERGICLAQEAGARAHFTHISTRESVELIRQAKQKNDLISCDATPHHFSLTEAEVIRQGSQAKVNPPLRTEADRQAILEGFKDGSIDFIVTDHAPHADKDKTDDLMSSAFGISQIETSLPASLTELHFKQGFPLMEVVRLMTSAPAALARLRSGRIQEGYPADITIVDLEAEKAVDRHSFVSKGHNSPFHGKSLKGWPVMTIVKGAVYED